MSSLYKLFSGWRSANEDEESDSDESFASCTEDSQVSCHGNVHTEKVSS